MTDKTIRDLDPGIAIQDGDLFITRQGTDTVDKSVTAGQIKTYIGADSGFFDGGAAATVYGPSNRNIDGGFA